MLDFKFYSFKDMDYYQQPLNSFWCWATCAQVLTEHFNPSCEIGSAQDDIVSYFKYLKSDETETESYISSSYFKSCTLGENQNIPAGCDMGIEDKHIVPLFEKLGFNATCVEDENDYYNYDFIVERLNENDCPLLIKIHVNGDPFKSHINLITGYGECEGRKYILVTDPSSYTPDYYYSTDALKSHLKIVKVWDMNLIVPDETIAKLKRDSLMEDNLKRSRLDSKHMLYIKTRVMKDASSTYPGDDSSLYDLLILETVNTICRETIKRIWIADNFISIIDQTKSNIHLNFPESQVKTVYFETYTTHAYERITEGKIYYLATKYPLNYNITKNWLEKEAFYNMLKQNPKRTFFNN